MIALKDKGIREITKIGSIGLGIMGKPMSKNLLKAGYQIVVCDIVESAVEEPVSAGAQSAGTPEEVAKQA
jgi:2-hydroxy-3-oxopropionate reductase